MCVCIYICINIYISTTVCKNVQSSFRFITWGKLYLTTSIGDFEFHGEGIILRNLLFHTMPQNLNQYSAFCLLYVIRHTLDFHIFIYFFLFYSKMSFKCYKTWYALKCGTHLKRGRVGTKMSSTVNSGWNWRRSWPKSRGMFMYKIFKNYKNSFKINSHFAI